jgi:hypothetical protein
MPELPSPVWEIGLSGIGLAAFAGADGPKIPGPFIVIPKN